MATLATVTAALETKIDALAAGLARMAVSDYRQDLESVPAGLTRYQIRGQYESDDSRNSAAPKKGISFIVEFHHRIDVAGGDTEADHVDVDMVTIQSAMTGTAWWKSLTGVYEVHSGPDNTNDVRREGNIVSYGIGARLIIDS